MSQEERPRERLKHLGAKALSNAELLAILLRTGTKGCSVLEVAQKLLQTFDGSLHRLLESTLEEICSIHGIGSDKALTLMAAFELVRRARTEKILQQPCFESSEQIARLMQEYFVGETRERLRLVLLNRRHMIIRIEDTADGLLDEIIIAKGEIFRKAILCQASEIILVHNHPTGDPEPSSKDIDTTRDLVRCGLVLSIPILDHIILGKPTEGRSYSYVSLRARGIIH